MADLRIVDVSTILAKWHDLLSKRWPNFPCQTFPVFMHNNSRELVCCKDCKHYGKYTDEFDGHVGYCDKIAYIMDGYYRGAEDRQPDDYCSQGERSDDHAQTD